MEERCLLRALDKIERLRGVPAAPPEWKNVLAQLAGALRQPAGSAYPERIASRLGERIQLLEVARITHCFARDKLTYAAMDGKNYVVDHTVAELEEKLDPRQFVRIHRSTLVNIAWVREIDAWFGGGNWNVVNLIFGSIGWLEGLVYVLVGLSALYIVFTHKKSCKNCDKGAAPAPQM